MAHPEQGYDSPPELVDDAPGVWEEHVPGVATRATRRVSKEEHMELTESVERRRGTVFLKLLGKNAHIQVGTAFQAPDVTELDPREAMEDKDRDREIWHNEPDKVDYAKLEEFLDESFALHGCHGDKAMYILQLSGYDLAKARRKIRTWEVKDEELSDDEKIFFRMALQEHGKDFRKIQQAIPRRSMDSVIQHYYLLKTRWRNKSHVQDLRGVEIINDDDPSTSEGRGNNNNNNNNNNNKKDFFPGFHELQKLESAEFLEGVCFNCGKKSHCLREVAIDEDMVAFGDQGTRALCLICSLRYEFTGVLPNAEFLQGLQEQKTTPHPPPEYSVLMKDFNTMSNLIRVARHEFRSRIGARMKSHGFHLRRGLKARADMGAARCRQTTEMFEMSPCRSEEVKQYKNYFKNFKVEGEKPGRKRSIWTAPEKFFAMHGFGRYGLAFDAVAGVVVTKTAAQVNSLYLEHKETIDKMMADREKVVNPDAARAELERMESNSEENLEAEPEEQMEAEPEETMEAAPEETMESEPE